MAENMTGMLVEETLVIGTGAKHAQGRGQRFGAIGVVAATLALLLVGSVAVHHRSTSQLVAPAIPRVWEDGINAIRAIAGYNFSSSRALCC
jgi:hypothetical protein